MKKILLFCIGCLLAVRSVNAQATAIQTNTLASFQDAVSHFRSDKIHLAAPIFSSLYRSIDQDAAVNHPLYVQELNFYVMACALRQNDSNIVASARQFISLEKNEVWVARLSYELAAYYFAKEMFADALLYYEKAGIAYLSNAQIALSKFRQAYCLFYLQRFAAAKPFFAALLQLKDHPLLSDAHYYYGFILFAERNYAEALRSFDTLIAHPTYGRVVPFYLASIYFAQDEKNKALQVATSALKKKEIVYKKELQQLTGHIYYEQRAFTDALPFLEAYQAASDKISKEDQYKLSVCYFETGKQEQAIKGLQQLSGSEDALSQSAMYLLAKAYLQKGEKENARNAFGFSAANNSNVAQREIALFYYSKLSYELGYQGLALSELRKFLQLFPSSALKQEATELLVAVLSATNNYRDALQLMEGLTSFTEETKKLYPVILYGRATELINDQQFNQAENLLDKILSTAPNASVLPLTYFWKGEMMMQKGNADEAISFFTKYLATNHKGQGEVAPQEAFYNLGYCYLQKADYQKAAGFFQKATGSVYRNAPALVQDAYLRWADCYYMQRNYKTAQQMYQQVIDYSWRSSDYALYQQAIIAGISNAKQKMELLKQLQQRYPSSSYFIAAQMEIARTYLANEQFGDAIPYLQQVANQQKQIDLKQRAMLQLGIAFYNINKNNEAVTAYRDLITQYPNTEAAADALENLRSLYVELGKPQLYADFISVLGKKIEEGEADSLAFAAADFQWNEGNCANAISLLESYLKQFPSGKNVIQSQFYRSECLVKNDDRKGALSGYAFVVAQGSNPWLEQASLKAARIAYFDIQDYTQAEAYFLALRSAATNDVNRMEALRGLLRSLVMQKKYAAAADFAKELLEQKNIGTDDRTLSQLAIGRALQAEKQTDAAIQAFKNVIAANKGAWAAEARYGIAELYFAANQNAAAEKAAFEVINKSGSYDFWVTSAYLLLGDIYFRQKDYFNAKATFQSVADNAADANLKLQALEKLALVVDAEKQGSKLEN